MNAFLDEAGTDAKSPVVTVAGFFGTKDQWSRFRELWKPHSAGFHALSCDALFPQMCDAIERSEIDGVFVTLGKETYKKVATEHMKSRLGNPYALCAFQAVLYICRVADIPTSFVFEQGQPNFEFVQKTLMDMMDIGENCIASVTPAKKADFIELHEADFVSHCASSYDKQWLERLFGSHRLKHAHLGEGELESVGPALTDLIKKARWSREKAKHTR